MKIEPVVGGPRRKEHDGSQEHPLGMTCPATPSQATFSVSAPAFGQPVHVCLDLVSFGIRRAHQLLGSYHGPAWPDLHLLKYQLQDGTQLAADTRLDGVGVVTGCVVYAIRLGTQQHPLRARPMISGDDVVVRIVCAWSQLLEDGWVVFDASSDQLPQVYELTRLLHVPPTSQLPDTFPALDCLSCTLLGQSQLPVATLAVDQWLDTSGVKQLCTLVWTIVGSEGHKMLNLGFRVRGGGGAGDALDAATPPLGPAGSAPPPASSTSAVLGGGATARRASARLRSRATTGSEVAGAVAGSAQPAPRPRA